LTDAKIDPTTLHLSFLFAWVISVTSVASFSGLRFKCMKLCWQIGVPLLAVAGCTGRPGAISPPSVDAADAAEQAIEQFDRSGDGSLSKEEWSASPELASAAERYDADRDGSLDVEDIATGLEAWQQTGIGARSVPFAVRVNGRPFAGATIRLLPAAFLGEAVKPATGETGPTGGGYLRMAPEDLPENAPNIPLVQPGLYRVEITHPSTTIPPKYNTSTTLGIEISSGSPGPEGITWHLNTK
jgi:hypothetical protein